MSWVSNLNHIRNFCEGCQVEERGGWLDGVVPINTSAESDAAPVAPPVTLLTPPAAATAASTVPIATNFTSTTAATTKEGTVAELLADHPMHHDHDQLMHDDQHNNLPTLAMLKNTMSYLRYSNNKQKKVVGNILLHPKILTAGSKILLVRMLLDLSVHQLMIFLQAYSYAQEEMNSHFLQKCKFEQFFDTMEAKEIKSDLKTIKACLQKIRDATSVDTTKIVNQIFILENVSIVKSV